MPVALQSPHPQYPTSTVYVPVEYIVANEYTVIQSGDYTFTAQSSQSKNRFTKECVTLEEKQLSQSKKNAQYAPLQTTSYSYTSTNLKPQLPV